jgi:hypothetical protein
MVKCGQRQIVDIHFSYEFWVKSYTLGKGADLRVTPTVLMSTESRLNVKWQRRAMLKTGSWKCSFSPSVVFTYVYDSKVYRRCDCSVIHLSNKAYVRREWLAENFNRTHLFPKGRPFAAVSPTLDQPFEVHFLAHHRSVRTLRLCVHVTTVIFAVPIPWLNLYILLIIFTSLCYDTFSPRKWISTFRRNVPLSYTFQKIETMYCPEIFKINLAVE